MKLDPYTKILFLFFLTYIGFQQISKAQIGINATGAAPASNAMLDIASTTKGFLIPRMTTAQRNALTHTQGLTVYDVSTNSYWYSNGAAWVNMASSSGGGPWQNQGNDISNINTGNVGIGTSTPLAKLSVLNNIGGYGITHNYGPVTMGTWINDLNGQLGTKSNHPLQFFTNNGSPQMTILPNGNIGIGTPNPAAKLDILDNNSSGIGLKVKGTSGYTTIDLDAFNGDAALRFYHDGVYKWNVRNNGLDDFQIYSQGGSGIPKFTIKNGTGKIGFRIADPQSDLHINPEGPGSILIGSDKNTGGFTNLEMGITTQSGGESFIQSTKSSGSAYGTLKLNPNGGDVTVAGYVGIGTNIPNSPLDIIQPTSFKPAIRILDSGHIWEIKVGGGLFFTHNGGATGAWIDYQDGTYNTFSDKRLKKNIEDISPVLDKIMQLKAKKYHFLESEDTSKKSTGFIAQEVIELFPELVSDFKRNTTDSTLYHGLNYAGFSVIAIKAIQEQQVIIEELKSVLKEYKTRFEAIEKKLN